MATQKVSTTAWRYEAATQTIRSVPENYWLASMNSFEGSVDHDANARLIATAPRLLAVLRQAHSRISDDHGIDHPLARDIYDAIMEAQS